SQSRLMRAQIFRLFRSLHINVNGGTGTHKVPVAIDVVNAVHWGPILIDPECAGRETRGFSRIGPVPIADQVLHGVRRVLERIILSIHTAFFDRPCLLATSSTVTPARSLSGRVSMMHSCATRPLLPV